MQTLLSGQEQSMSRAQMPGVLGKPTPASFVVHSSSVVQPQRRTLLSPQTVRPVSTDVAQTQSGPQCTCVLLSWQ